MTADILLQPRSPFSLRSESSEVGSGAGDWRSGIKNTGKLGSAAGSIGSLVSACCQNGSLRLPLSDKGQPWRICICPKETTEKSVDWRTVSSVCWFFSYLQLVGWGPGGATGSPTRFFPHGVGYPRRRCQETHTGVPHKLFLLNQEQGDGQKRYDRTGCLARSLQRSTAPAGSSAGGWRPPPSPGCWRGSRWGSRQRDNATTT